MIIADKDAEIPNGSETAQRDNVEEELAEEPAIEETPSLSFNDAEDVALIEDGKRKSLKRKGIKVGDPSKAKKAKPN